MEELADTVEYYHLIINRITDSRQNRTDKGLVDFQREWHPSPTNRIRSDNQQGIYRQGHNSTDRESHIAETQQYVKEDSYQGQYHRNNSPVGYVFCHGRTYLFRTDNRTSGTLVAVDESLQIQIRSQQTAAFERFEQRCFYFGIHLRTFFVNPIVCGYTYRLMVCPQGYNLDIGIPELVLQQGADSFRLHLLFEHNYEVTSAGEINTFAQTAYKQRYDTYHQQDPEYREGFLIRAHELVMCIMQELT